MYAVVAREVVECKLGDVSKVTALKYCEEEIGSAHESGHGKDGIDDISLPISGYDPEEEN
jgi:hypothetical protein